MESEPISSNPRRSCGCALQGHPTSLKQLLASSSHTKPCVTDIAEDNLDRRVCTPTYSGELRVGLRSEALPTLPGSVERERRWQLVDNCRAPLASHLFRGPHRDLLPGSQLRVE